MNNVSNDVGRSVTVTTKECQKVIDDIIAEMRPIIAAGSKALLEGHYRLGKVVAKHVDSIRANEAEKTGKEPHQIKMEGGFYEELSISMADQLKTEQHSSTSIRDWEKLARSFTDKEFKLLLAIPNINYSKIRAVLERAGDKLLTFDERLNYLQGSEDLSANDFIDKVREEYPTPKEERDQLSGDYAGDGADDYEGGDAGESGLNLQTAATKLGKLNDEFSNICSEIAVSCGVDYAFTTERKRDNFFDRVKDAVEDLNNISESAESTATMMEKFMAAKFSTSIEKKETSRSIISPAVAAAMAKGKEAIEKAKNTKKA